MQKNVGSTDRNIRLIAAVVAAAVAFVVGVGSLAGVLLLIVAVAMLVTATVGVCGLYKPFGINTCKR